MDLSKPLQRHHQRRLLRRRRWGRFSRQHLRIQRHLLGGLLRSELGQGRRQGGFGRRGRRGECWQRGRTFHRGHGIAWPLDSAAIFAHEVGQVILRESGLLSLLSQQLLSCQLLVSFSSQKDGQLFLGSRDPLFLSQCLVKKNTG